MGLGTRGQGLWHKFKSQQRQLWSLRTWLDSRDERERKAEDPVESLRTRREGEPKHVFEKIRVSIRGKKKPKKEKNKRPYCKCVYLHSWREGGKGSLIIEILLNRQQGNLCYISHLAGRAAFWSWLIEDRCLASGPTTKYGHCFRAAGSHTRPKSVGEQWLANSCAWRFRGNGEWYEVFHQITWKKGAFVLFFDGT